MTAHARSITYAEAICEAQREALRNDPNTILFGENVAAPWRPATKGLKEEFGKNRVRDAPITETAFIGAGVGAAIAGIKPIRDRRGEKDLFGYVLRMKRTAIADELASAAELVIGQTNEGIPAAIIRG